MNNTSQSDNIASVKTGPVQAPAPNRSVARVARRFILLLLVVSGAALLSIIGHFVFLHGDKNAVHLHATTVERMRLERDFLTLRLHVAEVLSGSEAVLRQQAEDAFQALGSRLQTLETGPAGIAIADRADLLDLLRGLKAKIQPLESQVKRFATGDDAAGYDLLRALDAAAPDYTRLLAALDAVTEAYIEKSASKPGAAYILLLLVLGLGALAVGVMARILLRQARRADAVQAHLVQLARDLETARRQAEAANRAKSSFLASMSHELRTPLNAVIGFADIMHQGLFGPIGNPRYEDYVASIQQSGQHLLSLINDILDMSRIEAGRFELHEERLDIDRLVSDCLALVDVQARGKGVTVRRGKRHDSVELWADDRALRQMLLNLLSNAVKFTNQGGEVTIEYGRNPDGWFEIVVRDSGIGMNESEVKRAFEPFARSDNQMIRQQFTGTGLGLPITRRLIELHGGRIQVVSRLGEGTSVTLRFPPERISTLGDFGSMFDESPGDGKA